MSQSITQFSAGELAVEIHRSPAELGRAAAERAAGILREAVAQRGTARIVVATGNSQFAFTDELAKQDVPWGHVTVFHMDEYVGIDASHPASFRRWVRECIEQRLAPAAVEYIDGDAADAQAECDRYEALLRAAELDLVCMGIGENGHLAFNEPFDADVDDPRWVRVIRLTDRSREQQVGEGHFPGLDAVPEAAITLTVPALLSARYVQVCVPEARKADAVAAALYDEIDTACPATALRRVPHATLFLEPASASRVRPAESA